MALLGTDFNSDEPTLARDPREGDNHIRDIKYRLKAWADVEHDKGTGWHKIYTNAATPTPAIVGHLWLRSTDSELFAYISGGSYTRLTSKYEVSQLQTSVTNLGTTTTSLQSQIDALEVQIANIEGDILNISNAQSLYSYTPGSYNLVVPANVYKILVKIWGASGGGGGGGGGGGNACGEKPGMPGGGGGGGGYCEAIVTVTPGETIPIVVGGKGLGGSANGGNADGSNGTSGGNSSFGSYISVTGGAYGTGGKDYDGIPAHGGGTLGSGGAVTITSGVGVAATSGSDGTSAIWNNDYTVVPGNGGSAATSYYSQIAAQAGGSSSGCLIWNGGTSGGKGGGGGGGSSGTGNGLSSAGAGGNGSDGFMIVSW